MKAMSSISDLLPLFELHLHLLSLVAHGSRELVIAGDLWRHNGEAVPVVAEQDGEHGGGLVVDGGRQLQPQTGLLHPLGRHR